MTLIIFMSSVLLKKVRCKRFLSGLKPEIKPPLKNGGLLFLDVSIILIKFVENYSMKVVSAYDVIMKLLETRESVTFYDLNTYRSIHYKTHPDEYLEIDRDSVLSAIDCAPEELYWVCDASHQDDRIIRQEVFVCPCCGNRILKYPNVEKFNQLVEFAKKFQPPENS